MLNRTTKTRLHIRSISEDLLQADHEIAELMREMRQATGLSRQEIANQLQTSLETIRALEQGHLSVLPPWNETSRVIVQYTAMLGLDSEPVLRRIMVQLPGDHPKRPKTQSHEPSYDNMRSNVSAVMNRVPADERPIENPSIAVHNQPSVAQRDSVEPTRFGASIAAPNEQYPSPGYNDMRAGPPVFAPPVDNRPARAVARKGKSGVFVLLMQLVLLLIILGAGYVMWLAVNDPPAYKDLEILALAQWEELMRWLGTLKKQY